MRASDIAGHFCTHDENTHTYACFRNLEESFFIVRYDHLLSDLGAFTFEEFVNQQSARNEIGEIKWHSEHGFITESRFLLNAGGKPRRPWLDRPVIVGI